MTDSTDASCSTHTEEPPGGEQTNPRREVRNMVDERKWADAVWATLYEAESETGIHNLDTGHSRFGDEIDQHIEAAMSHLRTAYSLRGAELAQDVIHDE